MKYIVTRFKKRAQTCSICLNPIEFQGKVDACQHTYCYDCILRWSEVENTCPVCKTRFSFVSLIPHRLNYRITRNRKNQIKIKQANQHMNYTNETLNATIRHAQESINQEYRILLRELGDIDIRDLRHLVLSLIE
ncbi:unnamed protein product [Blepharisma stoltei]|uniref:RING-type domain-containing protein n=1 Tax=Blepharisma stoltei TaxID=1481888 RepID=A0AAU9IUC2_9CILI|nr:unnamed protein product [Blepharisma stoltei]